MVRLAARLAMVVTGHGSGTVSTCLIVAILSRVQHPEPCQRAPIDAARNVEIGPRRHARHTHRLVLPPCLLAFSVVPEPATWLLIDFGLIGLAAEEFASAVVQSSRALA